MCWVVPPVYAVVGVSFHHTAWTLCGALGCSVVSSVLWWRWLQRGRDQPVFKRYRRERVLWWILLFLTRTGKPYCRGRRRNKRRREQWDPLRKLFWETGKRRGATTSRRRCSAEQVMNETLVLSRVPSMYREVTLHALERNMIRIYSSVL